MTAQRLQQTPNPTGAALLGHVALTAQSHRRSFLVALARLLRERHGSIVHLYCGSPEEVVYYEDRNGDRVFATITDASLLYVAISETPDDEAIELEQARKFELLTGSTYNLFSLSDRHLGRGFMLGGFRHPRSRYSESTDYPRLVHGYNRVMSFWQRELRDKKITLMINGSKPAATLARSFGITVRTMVNARYNNYYYWGHDEYFENPEIEVAYFSGAKLRRNEFTRPYSQAQFNRAKFIRNTGLRSLLKNLAITAARFSYWKLRRYRKAEGYFVRELLAYHVRVWRDFRYLRRIATVRLADIKDRKFVFFPLHLEPETALQQLSPEYFCQLAAIASIARDLPVGMALAVKEHFAGVGRRPVSFYDQIREFKNVVLLDTLEQGFDIAQQATATITICGSAGMEAAILGKPVVAFGRHNVYGFVPHVRLVTDEMQLAGYLRDIAKCVDDPVQNRTDGQRFLDALVSRCFDMRGYKSGDPMHFEDASVEDAYQRLVASLDAAPETVEPTKARLDLAG